MPAPAKQTKPVKEKTTQPSSTNKIRKGKVAKIRKGKSYLQLVDEDEEVQHKPEPQIEDDEYNLQRVTEEASTRSSTQPKDDTFANIVYDTPSPPDAEKGVEAKMSDSEGDTEILNAGSDPVNTLESRPPPDEDQAGSNPGQSHVALAGPNHKPMHKDFIATVYPKVHKSLKHTTEEQDFLENPPSLSGALSSMKNLDDAFTYGDQFLNDIPTEVELGKANVEAEVESMVIVPIHQASSSVPPLSTPVIDLTPPKPVSPLVQEPIFTATTQLLPPPPPQQQSNTDLALSARVLALEQICANLEKKNKVQDQTTQALSSRIFTLDHDLYSKIDKYINENVKEDVQNALQAPVRERFRELSEFEMKEILRDRMFESGSYKSHLENITLYEALEASMDRENREEFMDATAKSRKRCRDDQAPPPKYSDQNDVHISDSEDAGTAHLLKIKTRPDWLKPIPKEERPKTPEPDWVIPLNDLPEPENNWANAIAKSQIRKSKLSKEDLEGPAFKIDLVNPEGNQFVPNVSKPLPLGGPPGKLNHLSGSNKLHLFNVVNLWFRNIVIRKRVEDLQLGIESYQIKLNLTEPSWDATDFLFKEYYTIVSKPKVVIYKDRNNQKKMMRESEVHKFSDGTLTKILEKLDHMVKDFVLFNFNRGMEHRIWSGDDKRRSKEFIEVIERRLKIRRIFRSLECFVSGRLRDVDHRLIQRTE
ncbi:hypothetical protein Tco_0518236 [Tanacetum coccineum]